MVAPTLKVEFSFIRDGNDYVWNDVSGYVRSVSIDRGISRELEEYSAGQCEVIFGNLNREFDPSYLTPTTTRTNLVKNPIPSTSAAISPQENWIVISRGTGGAGTTTLTANGAFDTVTAAASTTGYSFGFTGSTNAQRIQVTAGVTYAVSFYATSSIADARRLSGTFYDAGGSSLGEVNIGVAQSMTAGVEMRFTGTYTAPAGAVSMRVYAAATTGSVIRSLGSTMTWRRAMVEAASSVNTYFDGSTTRTPNTENAWSGTAQSSSSVQTIYPSLYGRDVKPAGALRVTSGSQIQFYGFIDNWSFDYPDSNHNAVAKVVAYDALSSLSKAVLDEVYFDPQTTGSRIAAILSRPEIALNSSLQNLDGGSSTVQDELVAEGTNALAYCQQVAHSEPGDFFGTRDGKVAFRDRRYLDYNWDTATYRYNLCANPSLESSTTYWTAGSTSTTQKYYGTRSLVGDYNSSLNIRTAKYEETNATRFSASGTGTYTISAWFYLSGGSVNLSFTANLAGALVATASSSPAISLNTWTRVSLSLAIGSTFDELEFFVDNGSGSSIFYIDGVLIEKSASMEDYFDGAITPTASSTTRYTSSWDTATNLSSSTLSIQTLASSPSFTSFNLSDSSGTDIPVVDVKTIFGSEQLFNRIILLAKDGVAQVAEAASVQASYGKRSFEDGSYLNSDDTVVLGIANELLTQFSLPEFRAEEVMVALHSLNSTDQATLLTKDIRDVTKLTYQPSRQGDQVVKYYSVIGIAHEIAENQHFMTFKIASLANQAFRLDSEILGVLDSNVLSYPN
jgi:hypothetical protein